MLGLPNNDRKELQRETSDSPVCEAIQLKISEGQQHESDEQAWVVHSFQRQYAGLPGGKFNISKNTKKRPS